MYGTGMTNDFTTPQVLMNINAITIKKKNLDNSHQVIQNLHFHFHMVKICAKILGLVVLLT